MEDVEGMEELMKDMPGACAHPLLPSCK
jgi:hypothetical protein